MNKCEKCGRIIYKNNPLTTIGTGIGYLIATGVGLLVIAGVIWCTKILLRSIAL